MFDITSSKLLILAVVALIVVGPKDLPILLRTIGKYLGIIRRQAAEFRGQFDEAMREAELDGLKKEFEAVSREVRSTIDIGARAIDTQIEAARVDAEAPKVGIERRAGAPSRCFPSAPRSRPAGIIRAGACAEPKSRPKSRTEARHERRHRTSRPGRHRRLEGAADRSPRRAAPRLISSLIALGVSFVICFIFAKQIYNLLVLPYLWANGGAASGPIEMIYTAPQEFLFTQMKLALFGAVFLSFPIIANQIYKFVAPGLYKNERRAFRALPDRDAGAVPARRAGRLLPRHADGDALLPVDAADGRAGGDPPAGAGVGISRADHEPDHRLRHLLPAAGGADAARPRRPRHGADACARGAAMPSSASPPSPPSCRRPTRSA